MQIRMLPQPFHVDKGDNGVAYAYFDAELDFIDATAVCEEGNAQLALIETMEAKDRIFNFLKTREYSYWWIGLTSSSEGTWEWLDGKKLDRNIITFASEERGLGCGTLYQPRPGHLPSMYEYTCDRHKRSYVCETHLDSLDAGSESEESSATLSPAAIVALILGILLIVCVIIFITARGTLLKRSRGRNQEIPNREDQQGRIEEEQHSHKERNDCVDYATIVDDTDYATIDTVVYSEVIDDAYFSDVTAVGSDDGASPGNPVVYATVDKERKSSRANILSAES